MFVTLNPFIGSIARSHLDELIALLTFILCSIFKELKFIMLARDKTVFIRVNRSETPMPMTSGPNKVQVHSTTNQTAYTANDRATAREYLCQRLESYLN